MQVSWDPSEAIYNKLQFLTRKHASFGSVNLPIIPASTFAMDPEFMEDLFHGKIAEEDFKYLYGRHFHPNLMWLGQIIAAMEDMETGYVTASGMASVDVVLGQLTKKGDVILASSTIYGGSHALLKNIYPDRGIKTIFVHPNDTDGFRKAAEKYNPKVVYVETSSNPTLAVTDLTAISKIAKSIDAKFVVDNTFMPLSVTPAHFGADIVIHSLTKSINGASDMVGGSISCSKEFLFEIFDLHTGRLMLQGPIMNPVAAAQITERINTLPLRVKEQSKRAMASAKLLEAMGVDVRYPGLSSHPNHKLIESMLLSDYGYGGMMTIVFGEKKQAQTFVLEMHKLEAGWSAVSLGFRDTLVSVSGGTTSSEISSEKRLEMDLSPGLVRMSVGYTGNFEKQLKLLEQACKIALNCNK